ncbi:MAG TPA: phosphoenolpyruvate carboxykinase (ATP), partial [Pirellulaceae bacterium]|nr:phosphoenolpyruvate carboxykinase (ATP) [Pirellulaceae bacterium]
MSIANKSAVSRIAEGDFPSHVLRNASVARLYEEAVLLDQGVIIDRGAIAALSGTKTGRSPKDKRVVDQPSVHDAVWWGDV